MKYSDRMYHLAFNLRTLAPWRTVSDAAIFVFDSKATGERLYCNLMGARGEHLALGVYVGDQGLQSLYALMDHGNEIDDDMDAEMKFISCGQNMIQCCFLSTEDQYDDQMDGLMEYARAHSKRITGVNDIPSFVDCYPCYQPFTLDDEKRLKILEEALVVVKEHSEYLFTPEATPTVLTLKGRAMVPYYEFVDNEWKRSWITVPPYIRGYGCEPVEFENDILLRKLRKLPRGPEVVAKLTLLHCIVNDDMGRTAIPQALICAVKGGGYVFAPSMNIVPPEKGQSAAWKEMLNSFANNWIETGMVPSKFFYNGVHTYSILHDFCQKLKIELVETDDVHEVEEMEESLSRSFQLNDEGVSEEMDGMISQLCEQILENADKVDELPDVIRDALLSTYEEGLSPETIKKLNKVRKLLS